MASNMQGRRLTALAMVLSLRSKALFYLALPHFRKALLCGRMEVENCTTESFIMCSVHMHYSRLSGCRTHAEVAVNKNVVQIMSLYYYSDHTRKVRWVKYVARIGTRNSREVLCRTSEQNIVVIEKIAQNILKNGRKSVQ